MRDGLLVLWTVNSQDNFSSTGKKSKFLQNASFFPRSFAPNLNTLGLVFFSDGNVYCWGGGS